MRNNCENRENSFRQFLYEGRDLLSVRLLLAVNEGGERGRGKKKRKKKRERRRGAAGFGEKPDQRNQPNSDAAVRENLENGGI